jgi:hypothetical protein
MRKIRSKQFNITDFHEKKFETYKNMYHSQDTSESRYGQENNLFDFNNYYDLFMKSCDL